MVGSKQIVLITDNFPYGGASANLLRNFTLCLRNEGNDIEVILPTGASYGKKLDQQNQSVGYFEGIKFTRLGFIYHPKNILGKMMDNTISLFLPLIFLTKKAFNKKLDVVIVYNITAISFIPYLITKIILKKEILSKLACLALPEAYRTIEKYLQLPDKKLINWAKLALFESKMLLESSLLDQSHVLISSGLGGKNNMLRYFIVVYLKNEFSFDATKKKVVVNEFDSVLKKNNCETELLKFYNKYFTLTALIPLNVNLKHTFSDAINECNQYGNFLVDSFIVTNVKKLTISEINSLFDKLNNNVNEQSC